MSSDPPDPTPSVPVPPVANIRIQRASVVAVAIGASVAAAWVASGLWAGLLVGLLIAFAVEPAHLRILRIFPGRRGLAATLSVGSVVLLSGALLSTVIAVIARELLISVHSLREVLHNLSLEALLTPSATRTLSAVGITPAMISERAAHLGDRAAEAATTAVSLMLGSTLSWLGGALIAVLTAYNTLKHDKPIDRRLAGILPLDPRTTRELVEEFRKVGRGLLIGSVLAAIAQGLIGALGYVAMGVPRALLLGVATGLASAIPVVGASLVWVPVGIFLIATGREAAGIFEIVYNLLLTTTFVDYVLRPVLAGKESRSHPLLFIIGLIGGVEIFGAPGVIAGPIIMTIFASAIQIYRREVLDPARRLAE